MFFDGVGGWRQKPVRVDDYATAQHCQVRAVLPNPGAAAWGSRAVTDSAHPCVSSAAILGNTDAVVYFLITTKSLLFSSLSVD